MRFLFTTQPAYGHFYPMVALGQAAQRAGHEVVVATSASFGPTVEATGFPHVPAGIDWLEPEIEDTFPAVAAAGALTGLDEISWWLTNLWGHRMPRAMVPDLDEIIRTWRPDLVVHSQWELGGALAAELAALPYAMHSQGLLMSPTMWRGLGGTALDALRRDLGMAPDPDHHWIHRHCYLDDVPPSFQIRYDLPFAQRFRPVPRTPAPDEALPAWLGQLGDRPTVYASMGTVFNRIPQVFEATLRALEEEPLNLILVVGGSQDPASFVPRSEHVHVERFVPQLAVLRNCDVVICHAGYNTVAEALSQGLPLLTIPIRADQPINAERCRRLGVGLSLHPGEASPKAIREAVNELLENPRYRVGARRVRREIEAMPPIEMALGRLEQLVSTRP